MQCGVPPALRPRVEREVDSTNLELARARATDNSLQVLLAETQTAGRGRRGRHWISPPGCGLYLSMFRAFVLPPRRLGALSLVAGLATASAIAERCPTLRPGVKWPNDIVIHRQKLAGCLIDLTATGNAASAIIGVGVNVDFRGVEEPDQPWTDLARLGGGHPPDRNQLAAALIRQLDHHLVRFADEGFAPFLSLWQSRDVVLGEEVRVSGANGEERIGRARGVDEQGRLLIENRAGLHHLPSGDISLRRVR